jgi:hypothetical protein
MYLPTAMAQAYRDGLKRGAHSHMVIGSDTVV